MMRDGKKRIRDWIRDISYLGGLASVIFIMMQAYFAGRSIVESSEWEKAKMTIENIERFKEALSISPLSQNEIWSQGNDLWADASNPEKYHLFDTLLRVHWSLFDDRTEANNEIIRMIEAMDAFAYPIIMGYASETGSYHNTMRQSYTYGNFIMPYAFHHTPLLGIHAKLLYRLWRIRFEIAGVNNCIEDFEKYSNNLIKRKDHLLYYEETDITEASLKKYRKKLEKKLKEVQKEIEVFRKNNLK